MASPFASRVQQTIVLPFDEPHTVTIQKLSGRQLEAARLASQVAAVEHLRSIGGAAFQKELAGLGDPAAVADRVAAAQADPRTGFDRLTVLVKGIQAWTYDVPVSPEAIDDLSEEAADFLELAILALTLPKRGEAELKNGSGSSPVA